MSNTQPRFFLNEKEKNYYQHPKTQSREVITIKVPDCKPQIPDPQKEKEIEKLFRGIIKSMGLFQDPNSAHSYNVSDLDGTPRRVAKMFVREIFSGLNPQNRPEISLFPNTYQYDNMILVKDISFSSHCEHHFVPFIGKAHLAY
ncbi:MAG: GTP cyclohydrolase I, partial [Cytophagales bacterium]|nr:GTP cyclohydrolase I [Cytophagales bacterium]